MNFVLKYSPSPHTPLPRERGGVCLYFRPIFNWGEGISLLIILLFTAHVAHAQTFPVRVTPVLTPPYTPFLTDYTDPGAERLTLQIMLNDLTVTEFRTKLRMTIDGVGITITTNPNYFPPPISLQGGVPQLIYGSDIADYFKMSNLVFQGLNPNEVQKNGGRLPEGIYRISFEVLDYNRNTVVSNKGSATAWMILNDPPFINLPVNNAKIKPLNPHNIVFQWTPRHRGSPNAAFTTDYHVKLVEIWPAGRNPFDAINTSRPIFETTTSATMVVYGPAETPLVLGREYALQVKARDNGGRDVFKNNGYSEVVRFIYGDECPIPSGLNADDINISKARVRWQGSGQNSDYLLRYREKKEGARWFEEKTNQSYYNASGLRPGTTYEYTLAGECDIYQSDFTGIESFTTLAENSNAFVCADPNSVPPPDGSPPLPALFTNDFIHAGGFDVVVNKATGSNGRFTGEGLAVVPWFNSAKVRVTFENIGVNTSYQLTAGEIKSVWDPNSRSMLVNEKTIAEEGGPSNQFNSDIQTFEPDTAIMVTGVILSAYNDPDGNTVLETNEGRTVLPKGTSYAIADDAGNGYLVDKEGNIKKTTAADALAAGAKANREYSTDPNSKVNFIKAGNTKYGFDEPQTVLSQNYQQTGNARLPDGQGDKVAWKALAAGFPDNILAASQGVGDIGKATFKLEPNSQVLNPTTAGTGQVTLTLTGGGDGVVNELLAYYPNPDTTKTDLVAGKLNVVSYDLVNKNLVLITVNATTTTLAPNSLQTDLNNIYSQGVVQWTVNSTQSINVSGIDESALDDGGSGLLSNYTEDMKKILRAYTADHAMADNTYYLFLVKNSTSQSKLGYMPRKKQAGFIFVDAHSNADFVKTIAHELGHGAFHLKHTFSEYPSLSQGVTENLMDYPAKTRLDKWQWDHIHNPEAVLGLFEDDDEGALSLPCLGIFDDCKDVVKMIEAIRYARQKGESILIKGPQDGAPKRWEGNFLKFGDVDFDKISVEVELDPGVVERTDPTAYEDYDSDQEIGFVYRNSKGLLARIVISGSNGSLRIKRESLRDYLFGEVNEIKNRIKTRYIVYRGDANIRDKVAPYNLRYPEAFLQKGREVELISRPVEGENPRAIVKYLGEEEEVCTWTGNLMEIVPISSNQLYKLRKDLSPLAQPYSEVMNDLVLGDMVLVVTLECGIYKYINSQDGNKIVGLGWVKSEDLRQFVDISKLGKEEFSQKFTQATSKAVETIIADWKTNEKACNLCVRAALLNLTGDNVLFPETGSSLTILDDGKQIYGKVKTGGGNAQGIIDDLKSEKLKDYFEEIEKSTSESYAQYWERLQGMVDNNKEIIIGTYDPGHIFMIVPGGLHEVIDNSTRIESKLNLSDTKVELGDKWGGTFASRGYKSVPRVMDCGSGVKFSNGPMYGAMDAKPMIGEKQGVIAKFYKYKTK